MGRDRGEFLESLIQPTRRVAHEESLVDDLTGYRRVTVEGVTTRKNTGNSTRKRNSGEPKRYKSKTSVKRKKSKSNVKTVIRGAITLGIAGLIALGINGIHQDYQDRQNTISLSQSLSTGNTLEDLGLDENIANTLYELEGNSGREDITPEGKKKLLDDTLDSAFDVAKTKLANAANAAKLSNELIKPSDITLRVYGKDYSTSVMIKGVGNFEPQNIMNVFCGQKISPEIESFIKTIADIQGEISQLSKGEIDYDELPNICEQYLHKVSKFAAGKITVDEGRNFNFETERVSEYKKRQETNKKSTEDIERE